MSHIVFQERQGVNKVDSRLLAKELGIKNHRQWLYDRINPASEVIKKETKFDLEFDESSNTRGRKTRFVWLTEEQVYFVISLSKNNSEAIKAKGMMAKLINNLRNNPIEMSSFPNQWNNRKSRIVTTATTEPEMPASFVSSDLEGYFSPDIRFAEFLETLECESGYSMKWDFKFKQTEYPDLPVTKEQAKILKKYEKIAVLDDDADLTNIWHETIELPEPLNYEIASKIPVDGVVWVNERTHLMTDWNKWIEKVEQLVKVYHSDELRIQYGLPTKAQQESGDWEYLEEPPNHFWRVVNYGKFLKSTYNPQFEKRAYGFQVHKDWLLWLQSDEPIAKSLVEFYMGKEVHHLLDKHSKIIEYADWEAYKTGLKFWDDDEALLDESNKNPNAPLFQRVILYVDELRPLFDWYLQNIWLPQHSVKYFQETDPQGFPQLLQAMKRLPQDSKLPCQFIKAMQPLLADS